MKYATLIGALISATLSAAEVRLDTLIDHHDNGQRKSLVTYRLDSTGVQVKEGRELYWYATGQPRRELNWSGGLLHGTERTWFENGRKSMEAEYRLGRKEGATLTWHKSGKPESSTGYRADVLDGKEIKWFPDGSRRSERLWQAGRLQGLEMAWHENGKPALRNVNVPGKPPREHKEWSETGDLLVEVAMDEEGNGSERRYYPGGEPKQVFRLRKGVAEGPSESWHPGGRTALKVTYRDGRKEGLEEAWHENGARKYRVGYRNGNLADSAVGWYPGGQVQYHAFYRNGQLEGEARSWYESGKPKGLAVYQGGKRQGVQRSWHENGGPHLTVEYKGESIVKLDELAADGSRSDSTKSSLEKCRESGTL